MRLIRIAAALLLILAIASDAGCSGLFARTPKAGFRDKEITEATTTETAPEGP